MHNVRPMRQDLLDGWASTSAVQCMHRHQAHYPGRALLFDMLNGRSSPVANARLPLLRSKDGVQNDFIGTHRRAEYLDTGMHDITRRDGQR